MKDACHMFALLHKFALILPEHIIGFTRKTVCTFFLELQCMNVQYLNHDDGTHQFSC